MPNNPNLTFKSRLSTLSARTVQLAIIWLCVVCACMAFMVKLCFFNGTAPIETNILQLLPKNQHDPLAEHAFEQVIGSVSDQVVFVLQGESSSTQAAAKAFEGKLTTLDLFAQISGQMTSESQNQWARFYYQHRFQLLTPQQQRDLTLKPALQVTKVLQQLYNPFSGVTAVELEHDPFLLFRDYLAQLRQLGGQFQLQQGYLSQQNGQVHSILITAKLNGSPYSMSLQSQLPHLLRLEQQIEQDYGVDVLHTGVLFYADYGTRSAKAEISTIGLGSLIGGIILVLWVFRSPLPLGLALLSITSGLVVAFSLTCLIFGRVHLFSLVFGASLIGVSIDYAFHFLTERLAAGQHWDSQAGLKHIFIAITLGLLTSLIGYLGLLVAPFPGLQQLALFSSLGLIAAYASVVCWYPILASTPSATVGKKRELPGLVLAQRWLTLWQRPSLRYGAPVSLCIVSFLGLTHASYNDDIHQLQAMPSGLKQQEHTISQLAGVSNSQQMLLVTASTAQQVLQRITRLEPVLNQWQQAHTIKGYQAITQYYVPLAEQKHNYQLVSQLYLQQSALLAKKIGLHQVPTVAPFAPLNLNDFLHSVVSKPIRFLWLGELDGHYASVVMLNEVHDRHEIKQWVDQHDDIRYLNKADEVSTLFAQYRIKVTELLIAAATCIMLLLAWRYNIKQSVMMLLPSVIAGVAGLAVTVLLGSSLNLFNLLALILILGIGLDYTLFFAEHQKSYTTLLAISLSAITTILSFGLLALSHTYAIHSFGVTILVGIFIAWLLAPMAIPSPKKSD